MVSLLRAWYVKMLASEIEFEAGHTHWIFWTAFRSPYSPYIVSYIWGFIIRINLRSTLPSVATHSHCLCMVIECYRYYRADSIWQRHCLRDGAALKQTMTAKDRQRFKKRFERRQQRRKVKKATGLSMSFFQMNQNDVFFGPPFFWRFWMLSQFVVWT